MNRKLQLCMPMLLLAISITINYLGRSRELNVKNFSLIESGMTQAQVESLLGGPPGHYGNSNGQGYRTLEAVVIQNNIKTTIKTWNDKNHCFDVYFDANGQVVCKHQIAHYWEPAEKEGFIRRNWKAFCNAVGF